MTGKCFRCGKEVVVKWHPIWFSSKPKIRLPLYRGECKNKRCPAYGIPQIYSKRVEE